MEIKQKWLESSLCDLLKVLRKKNFYEELENKERVLNIKLKDLEHKISLVENNNFDYLDMLFREKFKYGTKDEIIIKLK